MHLINRREAYRVRVRVRVSISTAFVKFNSKRTIRGRKSLKLTLMLCVIINLSPFVLILYNFLIIGLLKTHIF